MSRSRRRKAEQSPGRGRKLSKPGSCSGKGLVPLNPLPAPATVSHANCECRKEKEKHTVTHTLTVAVISTHMRSPVSSSQIPSPISQPDPVSSRVFALVAL